jgi:hypothetical protein
MEKKYLRQPNMMAVCDDVLGWSVMPILNEIPTFLTASITNWCKKVYKLAKFNKLFTYTLNEIQSPETKIKLTPTMVISDKPHW